MALLLAAFVLSGSIPVGLGVPTSVFRIGQDGVAGRSCALLSAQEWRCLLDAPQDTLVVMTATEGIAYRRYDERGTPTSTVHIRRWGRLVTLESSGGSQDLGAIAIRARQPERPAMRPLTKRFTPIDDLTVDIVRLSGGIAWVAGDSDDPQTFLEFEGPAIGSTRAFVEGLRRGPVDVPYTVELEPAVTVSGRVQTGRGLGVRAADVQIFEALPASRNDGVRRQDEQAWILRATARTDGDGTFAVDRLSPGAYLVVARSSSDGRSVEQVDLPSPPLIVALVAPLQAVGRVLWRSAPVSRARVRFVPRADALASSEDADALLTEDVTTDEEGRFALTLPPSPLGSVQIVGLDGSSARLPVPPNVTANLALGDVALPAPRRLTVRLSTAEDCVLSAAGPLGGLGMSIARATSAAPGTHVFELPEVGEWVLDAECRGRHQPIAPGVAVVPAAGDAFIDAHLER